MGLEVTFAAQSCIERAQRAHDGLVVVVGSGCCEGPVPLLFSHHLPDPLMVPLGSAAGVLVLAPPAFVNTPLVLDCVPTSGGEGWSLEESWGQRLVLREPLPADAVGGVLAHVPSLDAAACSEVRD